MIPSATTEGSGFEASTGPGRGEGPAAATDRPAPAREAEELGIGPPGTVAHEGSSDKRLLIVASDPTLVSQLRRQLREWGFRQFQTSVRASETLALVQREPADLLLLDCVTSDSQGLLLLQEIRGMRSARELPVLLMVSTAATATRHRAIELGVSDFVSKPIDPAELGLRVQNTLQLAQQQIRLAGMEAEIERRVELRTAALLASRREALQCLARAGEYRDHGTGKHVLRVSLYAGTIARELGLAEDQAELIEEAALLHDIGKIGISDYILLKPSRLTPAEFNVMKQHCLFGRDILRPTPDDELPAPEAGSLLCDPCDPASVMELAASIAMSHHEWWDGQGYPLGRAGEQIPLEGRITAVADVYDALSSRRPYKPPYTSDQCFAIMRQNCGRQFDPRVFEAFVAAKSRILEIQAQYADEYALPMPDRRQEDMAVIDQLARK